MEESLLYLKLLLAYPAKRAYPILGKVLKCNTRLDTLLRVADFRVIYPMAYCTDILFHKT